MTKYLYNLIQKIHFAHQVKYARQLEALIQIVLAFFLLRTKETESGLLRKAEKMVSDVMTNVLWILMGEHGVQQKPVVLDD